MPLLWLREVPEQPQRNFQVKRLNDSTARDFTIEGIKLTGPKAAYVRGYIPFAVLNVSDQGNWLHHDMAVNARDAVTEELPAGLKALLDQTLGVHRGATSGFIGVVCYTSLAGERFSSTAWWLNGQTPKSWAFDGADFLRQEVSLADVLSKWGPEIRRTIDQFRGI